MAKRRIANKWKEILKSWEESGESQASFCRRNNIPLSTFGYHLKKKFADDVGGQIAENIGDYLSPIINGGMELIKTKISTLTEDDNNASN